MNASSVNARRICTHCFIHKIFEKLMGRCPERLPTRHLRDFRHLNFIGFVTENGIAGQEFDSA
jgi:hypothetical protein